MARSPPGETILSIGGSDALPHVQLRHAELEAGDAMATSMASSVTTRVRAIWQLWTTGTRHGGRGVTTRARTIWQFAQVMALAAGIFIWGALILKPTLGLHLLWNVLIPIAPALFVLAPGVWRNLCPLGTLSLAPSHFGLSQGKLPSRVWRG